MESDVRTPFCAICGRTHDPKLACASVTGFKALEKMGENFSKEKDTNSSFEKLSRKTDKLMITILIIILIVLLFIMVKST